MSQGEPNALRLEVLEGNIALLTIDQPNSRANTLGQGAQADLERMLGELDVLHKRTPLQGLIFRSGKPGMFVAGADLNELGRPAPDPEESRRRMQRGLDIIAAFESLPYPTVAAIDGACMGGGLELAMGFDFRVASTNPKTLLGQPEVKVGLIPGWGGTQRLPRIVGAPIATEMICSGEPASAERARQIGLVFDAVPAERLLDEARRVLEWARESGASQESRQRKCQPIGLTEEQHSFTFGVARAQVLAKTKGQYPAPLAAIEAIAKGCNLSLEEGLKVETEAFLPLLGSPISRNLIAVFFMDQELKKDTGVADRNIKPRDVNLVGVVGAGLMGAGIAGAHIRRGIPVVMLDNAPAALEKGVAANLKVMQARVEIGRMTQKEVVESLARLSTSLSLGALADRDVVVEAIVENEEAKTKLFQELQGILRS